MYRFLDGERAIVLPPRCGARYTQDVLRRNGLIPPYVKPGDNHHRFDLDLELDKELTIYMMCRNPFTHVRSWYRWWAIVVFPQLCGIENTFDEFFRNYNHSLSPSRIYGIDKISRVDKFIQIEHIQPTFSNLFDITEFPKNAYHIPADDLDDFEVFKDNPEYVEKVLEEYKWEFENIDLDLGKYEELI